MQFFVRKDRAKQREESARESANESRKEPTVSGSQRKDWVVFLLQRMQFVQAHQLLGLYRVLGADRGDTLGAYAKNQGKIKMLSQLRVECTSFVELRVYFLELV